jgi:hypothetical protein
MSKKSRPWTRQQRRAIRRRTERGPMLRLIRWHAANVQARLWRDNPFLALVDHDVA